MELTAGAYITPNLRLTRPLGQGGMASVWGAEQLALRTEVAVKFIDPQLAASNPEMQARFMREASTAAQIKSPHVVQMFDHGFAADGTPYIVMELMHGESLRERFKRQGRMAPAEVSTVLAQAGRALDAAHRLGIIHRDIKPANLFLVASGYDIFIKVLDFGIAKTGNEHAVAVNTASFAVIGTPRYMSPEQLMSTKNVTPSTDLWALGVIAYEALLGRPPYEGDTVPQLTIEICTADFVPPSHVDPSLPQALDGWFMRVFQPEPHNRFASAAELAAAFDAACAGSAPALHSAPGVASGGQAPAPGSRSGTMQMAAAPPLPVSGSAAVQQFLQHPAGAASQLAYGGMQPASGVQPYGGMQPASGVQPYGGMQPASGVQPYGGMQPASGVQPYGDMQAASGAQPYGGMQPYGGVLPQSGVQPHTAMQQPLSGSTTSALSMGRGEPQQPKSSKPVVLVAVVGALVLAGVAGGVLLGRTSGAAQEASNGDSSKMGATCYFERCDARVKVPTRTKVEPLDFLKSADTLAHQMESEAKLVMISVSTTSGGRFSAEMPGSVSFMYVYPKQVGKPGAMATLQIIINHQQMMARRTPDMGIKPTIAPRCSMQAGMAAVVAAGFSSTADIVATYMQDPQFNRPAWRFNQLEPVGTQAVDGQSCKIIK